MTFHNKNCTHIFIMTFHNKNCTHIFMMTFHNENCTHIFYYDIIIIIKMKLRFKGRSTLMRMRLILSRTDYARANTGGSNSAVLGCSLAQSQARAPVEANYAKAQTFTNTLLYVCAQTLLWGTY